MHSTIILVVEDVEETRDAIEGLLEAAGYVVTPARNENEAVLAAHQHNPHLILISLGSTTPEVVATGMRIRQRAGLSEFVPIVVFCCPVVPEGAEVELERNVYLTRPDNFDHLRQMLRRVCLKHMNQRG